MFRFRVVLWICKVEHLILQNIRSIRFRLSRILMIDSNSFCFATSELTAG